MATLTVTEAAALQPPPVNTADPPLQVGERVEDGEGFSGTVRYVGLIPKSPNPAATWIGVEWDDVSRGRYDGSIYDVVYFVCTPGAASFIKPDKLRRGVPFTTALREKYQPDPTRAHIRVHCKKLTEMDETGGFNLLRNVDLSKQRISRAASGLFGTPESSIAHLCPNLTELSLADNLLTSWSEVLDIARNLPRLGHLNLSGNRLQESKEDGSPTAHPHYSSGSDDEEKPETASDDRASQARQMRRRSAPASVPPRAASGQSSRLQFSPHRHRPSALLGSDDSNAQNAKGKEAQQTGTQHQPQSEDANDENLIMESDCESECLDEEGDDWTHGALRCLILNGTRCTWTRVNALLKRFPQLEELHLGGLGYRKVELKDPPQTLQLVNLSCNRIFKWSDLGCLGSLPNLHTLLLRRNAITRITPDDVRGVQPPPAQTTTTAAAESSSAGASAGAFPTLFTLSMDSNPITDWESLEAIDLLPQLVEVNVKDLPVFDTVPEADRRKLAISFMSKAVKVNRSRVTPKERENAERFFVRKFSTQPNPPQAYTRLKGVHGDLKPLVDILFKKPDENIQVKYNDAPLDYKPDLKLPLWDFMCNIAEAVGAKANLLQAFHKSPYSFDEMKFPQRALHSYRILEGDEIHVFDKKSAESK